MPKPRHASIEEALPDEFRHPGLDPSHEEPLLGADTHTYRGVHFATLKEKQKLWWKNAYIDALFICSW